MAIGILKHALFAITCATFLPACAGNVYDGAGIFSYSKDRCQGAYNQCRLQCIETPNPSVAASCLDRCQESESQCYAVGPDNSTSTIAQESLIGLAKSETEKREAYEQWRLSKQRERAASGESDVEIIELDETTPSDE